MAENKQTNSPGSWRSTDFTFTSSLSELLVSSPWPRPGPSPGLAAGTKPPLCAPALGSQPGTTSGCPPPRLLLKGFGAVRRERVGGEGWAFIGAEWRMGCVWEPCPDPPVHLWKRPALCQFAMQISPLGAWMAGTKQPSADGKCHSHFDSWPFFSQTAFTFSGKKRKKRTTSSHLGGFGPNPHSASAATLDSKEQRKEKSSEFLFRLGGSNCHSHWDGVKYVKRERSAGNSLLCSVSSVRC